MNLFSSPPRISKALLECCAVPCSLDTDEMKCFKLIWTYVIHFWRQVPYRAVCSTNFGTEFDSQTLSDPLHTHTRINERARAHTHRPKQPLILYEFEACPFCRKVLHKHARTHMHLYLHIHPHMHSYIPTCIHLHVRARELTHACSWLLNKDIISTVSRVLTHVCSPS